MAKVFLSVVLCVALCGATVRAQCSKGDNGTAPVSGSCDAYIQCKDGVAEERVCPDGLLYNGKASGYPCSYPIDVECEQPQSRLQSAQPTDECPHQFGYFRMGDDKHCGQFKNCVNGKGFVFDCPEGLAWNPLTYRCEWPDMVTECNAEAFLGFKCPQQKAAPKSAEFALQEAEYKFYPSPDNCQVYFICIEGRPRRIGCGEGFAFNPETLLCDDIDNVSTCSSDIKKRGQEIKAARESAAKARAATRN